MGIEFAPVKYSREVLIFVWLRRTEVRISSKKYEANIIQSKVEKFDCIDEPFQINVRIITQIQHDLLFYIELFDTPPHE